MKKSSDLSFNFSLIKPDGVAVVDKVIRMFVNYELEVRAGKPFHATEEQVGKHFKIDDAEHTIKMGKILCGNFEVSGFSKEKIAEVVGFSCSTAYTFAELHKKAGEVLFEINKAYFLSGRLIPLIISGAGDVIALTRKITGATNPIKAEEGTIRHTFSYCDMIQANLKLQPAQNIIHTSGNAEERDAEKAIWWPE